MKILTCTTPGKMEYGYRDIPVPAKDEVLLKIKRVGICGTDLHAFAGRQPYFDYPRIMGHEICAEMADPNGHDQFLKGELVTLMPYFYCGNCYSCKRGRTNCCSNLRVAGVHSNGAMQEYFAAPAHTIIKGINLTAEQLALVEPFAIGAHALYRADIKSGDQILILGAGPIGIGLALLAIHRNAEVIIADVDNERLSLCKSIAGLRTIAMNEADISEKLADITDGQGIEFVFDASGNLRAIESTLQLLAHGGKIVLVGIQKEAFKFSHPDFHKKETTLMSSRNAVWRDFDEVIEYFTNDGFGSFPYISQTISFDDAASWFMDSSIQKNKLIKCMISFDN